MYNEEIKQQFLDTLEHNSRRLTIPIFNKIEAKEEEYNTDYCKMTRGQIIDTIAIFGTETNIRPTFSRLRKYSKWCKENGYNKGIDYSDKHITTVDELVYSIGQLEKRYYISEEYYRECIKTLKSSDNAAYLTSLLMACYEGIVGDNFENLVYLRVKDLRHGTHITLYDGTKRTITEELRSLLIEASTVEELYSKYTVTLKYSPYPDSIWKSTRRGKDQSRKFASLFDNRGKIKDLLDNDNVTIEALSRSGFFNYVKNRSKELGYDLKNDMLAEIPIMRTNGNKGRIVQSDLTEKYDRILKEYGTDMKFFNFRRNYRDWICYI